MDQHTCKTYVQQNSFLFKHHETKIDEVVWNCTKIQACALKKITPKSKIEDDIPITIVGQ